jgi:hypothetical protein
LLAAFTEQDVDSVWQGWFTREYSKETKISYRELYAAILYPYEILSKTHKNHFKQLNAATRAALMHASEINPSGVPRKLSKMISRGEIEDVTSPDDLFRILDRPFISNAPDFLMKVKPFEKDFGGIIEHICSTGTALQTFNFGVVLKSLGHLDTVLSLFDLSRSKGNQRAGIEMGSLLLKGSYADGEAFFPSLGSYGFWKIAQCNRYGINTVKDMAKANEYYLRALSAGDPCLYPELLYDAAEFAVFYAYSQPDAGIFQAVMDTAIRRFIEAGNAHLWVGFYRAAELILATRTRIPDFASSVDVRDLVYRSIVEGNATKSQGIMARLGMDDNAETIVRRAQLEQIERYFS